MESGGKNGRGKRRKKFTDEAHQDNAKRQALWRRRHPDKYEQFKAQLRLQTLLRRGSKKPGGWMLYEKVSDSGEIIGVRIRHHSRPRREGEYLSDFLPQFPLPFDLAVALRHARLRQLQEWRDDSSAGGA